MDLAAIYQAYLQSGAVSTDTRKITPGSVFFALKGDKFNANEFAEEALARGASFAVVDEAKFARSEKYFLVEDSLKALQELARHHRSQLKIPVVGLTGSNGKTTSKELVNAVLSTKYRTFATQGNLNNHIGVPLTILSIGATVEIAVVEMGANHMGEIALLSSICNPTHGFITNIGKAHIGTFGGMQNIIKGKTELYAHLLSNDGVVFVNSQNQILKDRLKNFAPERVFSYPATGDYYHCEMISVDPCIKYRTNGGDIIQTSLMGAYNFENMAVALTIGKYFGVDEALANQAVAGYTSGNMRSQVMRKANHTIILDAYNANPSSMQAAVENLALMNAQHKVVILGDMYELEEEAEKEHRALGKLLSAKKIETIFLCGKLIRWAKEEIPYAHYFETRDALEEYFRKNSLPSSTILIKASRGMQLEKVVDSIG